MLYNPCFLQSIHLRDFMSQLGWKRHLTLCITECKIRPKLPAILWHCHAHLLYVYVYNMCWCRVSLCDYQLLQQIRQCMWAIMLPLGHTPTWLVRLRIKLPTCKGVHRSPLTEVRERRRYGQQNTSFYIRVQKVRWYMLHLRLSFELLSSIVNKVELIWI